MFLTTDVLMDSPILLLTVYRTIKRVVTSSAVLGFHTHLEFLRRLPALLAKGQIAREIEVARIARSQPRRHLLTLRQVEAML